MGKPPYDLLHETRTATEEVLAKMLQIKKEGKNRGEFRELVTQASVLFLNLRQINRIILQDEDRAKVETEAAKIPVDHTTLQLHNLLYEKNHYLKAIKACKDFKSKYPDIELVPEEDFFRDAPDEFKASLMLKDDPHKRMLERLNFELYQRKELCKQRELLEARKKMLQESIANRKKFISSLPSHLKALKKASLPVQQHLGIMHTKRRKQHQLAELLPSPLYILFSQILSQKEAFDEAIDIEILGSAKDAQALVRQQALKDLGTSVGSLEEARVDEDVPEEDDDSQRRRKRAKKSQWKENSDNGGIYQSYPLFVILHIYDDERSEIEKPNKLLTLRFEYLLKLNVVCVGTEFPQEGGPLELLTNLFPDDTGLDLPNQVAKLSAGTEFQYDEKRPLRPYKWAQHLSGIDFLAESPPTVPDAPVVVNGHSKSLLISSGLAKYRQQYRALTVLHKLRARRKAHLALKDQLDMLAKLKCPSLKLTTVPWGFHNAKSSLQRWAEIKHPGERDSFAASGVLPMVSGNADGTDVALKIEAEAAREDGELPVGAFGSISSASPEVTGDGDVAQQNLSVSMTSNSALLGFDKSGLKPGSVNGGDFSMELSGNMVSGTDFLVEYSMDHIETLSEMEAMDSADIFNVKQRWEDCGIREFCVVLRREDGLSGKPVELEAEVKISSEYPVRPPHFSLCLLSHDIAAVIPPAPRGVLDVVETFHTSKSNMHNFNELRAMEAEVNVGILDKLPQSEENDILAHQVALLLMLFDGHVDYELSVNTGSDVSIQGGDVKDACMSELVGGKMVTRMVRGRDRQKLYSLLFFDT